MLLELSHPDEHLPGWLPKPYALDESDILLPKEEGAPVAARLYRPHGLDAAPGLVVLHGVHRLGIHDPRLITFARAMAGAGVVVLTPEIHSLTKYHVDASGVTVIGDAASWLSEQPFVNSKRVGLMGMSFAGGLALLTAADSRFSNTIGTVVAVGAHDDLERVSHFFATNQIALPSGQIENGHAHEYGALVLAYDHPEDFFATNDVSQAEEVLRTYLWEQKAEARTLESSLSAEGRARMDELLDAREHLRDQLEACVVRHASEMSPASPHGHLSGLRAGVYLLHGSGDTVIPPSETAWLARDLPQGSVRSMLITPLLEHVSIQGEPGLLDRVRMVHFMASVLHSLR
jgi:acetyl esterase/lipase